MIVKRTRNHRALMRQDIARKGKQVAKIELFMVRSMNATLKWNGFVGTRWISPMKPCGKKMPQNQLIADDVLRMEVTRWKLRGGDEFEQ